jgi:redox-sensitive bicupin YhaK (pirin superfamily)
MTLAANHQRTITHKTTGYRQGPITRLMSPGDLGQIAKPFVFLDLFDLPGAAAANMGLHPHSGIATVTYLIEGSVGYEDTDGNTGILGAGGLEWMKAGGGTWHGGAPGGKGRARGFQLWVAMPPEHESGPAESIYHAPSDVPAAGPVTVLLGRYGAISSRIVPPSPLSYLAVRLAAGERWQYTPPPDHTVCWVALATGTLFAGKPIWAGEMALFEQSDRSVEFEAREDSVFVLGSAVPHEYELVLGRYSVHTSPAALTRGEARIAELAVQRHPNKGTPATTR